MYDFRRSSHKFPTIYWNLIFPISSSLSYISKTILRIQAFDGERYQKNAKC